MEKTLLVLTVRKCELPSGPDSGSAGRGIDPGRQSAACADLAAADCVCRFLCGQCRHIPVAFHSPVDRHDNQADDPDPVYLFRPAAGYRCHGSRHCLQLHGGSGLHLHIDQHVSGHAVSGPGRRLRRTVRRQGHRNGRQ